MSAQAPTDTVAPTAGATDTITPGPSPTVTAETHTVAAGDTLGAIAKEHRCDLSALAAYNGIADPSLILAGQVLAIPPADYVPPIATAGPPSDTPEPALAEAPTASAGLVPSQVVDVVDGDTIKVSIDGQVYTIRYIGVDTPETVHPEEPVEWMGPEASAFNAQLVSGQTVYLEKDISETDQYGRLLRYVWLADRRMVNEELCRQGYAQVSTYPPDVKYVDRFLAAEQEARDAGRGLWATPPQQTVPTDTPVPAEVVPTPEPATSTPAPTLIATPQPALQCDPSYPDVCIPPYPPDLDCGQIPFRRFRVIGSDPHGFDGDNDGVGCER